MTLYIPPWWFPLVQVAVILIIAVGYAKYDESRVAQKLKLKENWNWVALYFVINISVSLIVSFFYYR